MNAVLFMRNEILSVAMYSQCLGHREIRNSPLALASSEFQTSLSYIKIFWLYFLTQVTNKSYMIAEGPNIPSPGYHHLSTGKNIWDAGYTDLTIHVLCGRTHTNISTQSQRSLKEKKKNRHFYFKWETIWKTPVHPLESVALEPGGIHLNPAVWESTHFQFF